MVRLRDGVQAAVGRFGFEIRRRVPAAEEEPPPGPDVPDPTLDFRARARPILERHAAQTLEDVAGLRRKYEQPVFGERRVWDLLDGLPGCIDPTDQRLFCASQHVHVLQMLEAMEADGTYEREPDLRLATLIHDLGKLLLLTDEDPANVVCMNEPIGRYEDGVGLDQVTFQWNHDEFGYARFRHLVPEHVSWLIRYHSIDPHATRHLMDERDLAYADRYLLPFFHHDHATKTPHHLPTVDLRAYRDLLEEAFPHPIPF